MAARAKFSDSAVAINGVAYQVVPNADVTLYVKGTTTPWSLPIYAAITGGTTKPNPFTADANGVIEFFLDLPDRVKIETTGISGGIPVALTADYVPVMPDPSEFALWNSDRFNLAKSAAPSAPAGGLSSLYARTDGGGGIVPAGGTARLFFDTVDTPIRNVRHYGALGDGVTDDTVAIQAALDAGGMCFFPPGEYMYTALDVDLATPAAIVGSGPGVTYLRCTQASGDSIVVDGPSRFLFRDLMLFPAVQRDAAAYLLSIIDVPKVWIDSIESDGLSGMVKCDGVNSLVLTNSKLNSTNGTTGDTCLRLIDTSFVVSGCTFQTAALAAGRGPTVHISGTSNSSRLTDCLIAGGGPTWKANILSTASTAGDFTIEATTWPGVAAGDLIVIRDNSTAAYNNQWRVASVNVPLQRIVVTSTLNPGATASSGTVEGISAAIAVDNSAGSYNESIIANTLTARVVGGTLIGSASVYVDARRSATHEINGWTLNGNWYDYGETGILIAGRATGSGACTAYRFAINGGLFAQRTRPIHLDQVQGVTIDGVHVGSTIVAPLDDGLSAASGIYIWAGTGAPLTRGISISNSHIGMPGDFAIISGTLMPYGVLIDGAVDLLSITGGVLGGATKPMEVLNVSGATLAGLRWTIAPGKTTSALPVTATSTIPTVASASSIAAAFGYDTFAISGTTNISTITNGWHGRVVTLLMFGSLTFATGGNLAPTASRTIVDGDAVRLVFHGGVASGVWFVR